jgi:hypothetical protein
MEANQVKMEQNQIAMLNEIAKLKNDLSNK